MVYMEYKVVWETNLKLFSAIMQSNEQDSYLKNAT